MPPSLPVAQPRLDSEADLEEFLTRPSPQLVESIQQLRSPLLVLGAGGKMGPTLAILAHRAAQAAGHPLKVVAVSRFGDPRSRATLESQGITTIPCDLFDRDALSSLPDSTNIVYLVGLKFGTAQNPSATWAANTIVPSRVCERFPKARLVALSTGNVYPPQPAGSQGAPESARLTPLGEYANAAVGRERIFEHYSSLAGTPVALIRLFYAVELRYGVLVDIARKVHAGLPIQLANGRINCIWQADANEMILRSFPLASAPPSAWNLCRPESFSVRDLARRFAALFNTQPRFEGVEAPTALLGDSSRLCAQLGDPATPLDSMIQWIARWIQTGGRLLGRPTHFETRDGSY